MISVAPRQYGFDEKLDESTSSDVSDCVRRILLEDIPGAINAHPSGKANDKLGTDWWVEVSGKPHVAVDVKIRKDDYNKGKDKKDWDVALETWSVCEKEIIGWTRDPSKRCDKVLWYWKDTHHKCMFDFMDLCQVFGENWRDWAAKYPTKRQRTNRGDGSHYHSECVMVPTWTIWAAIYEKRNYRPA